MMPPYLFPSAEPAPAVQASPSIDPAPLYFAYGINLSLARMAQRCPGSEFVGPAKLHGYQWQINEQGVANVVPAGGSSGGDNNMSSLVEGLVFRLTRLDEALLDSYEDESGEAYQKRRLPVQLAPHPRYADQPTAAVRDAIAQGPATNGGPLPAGPERNLDELMTDTTALVYVREPYAGNGRISSELSIDHMRNAVKDAAALGVSQAFVDEVIAPHLCPPMSQQS